MTRTRFAPSPTGSLHVGNARTAVLNWLFARKTGGAFVLRIEDTDVERTVPGSEAQIFEDLRWLGLDWEEGPDTPDTELAPYRQSERGVFYRDATQRLLEAGHAYRCFCSEETLERKREEAMARGAPPHYDRTCRALDAATAAERVRGGERASIRFATPDEGVIAFDDVVRGRIEFPAADIGDFILLRSDGLPTYNFAVVVDDAAMRISHVIRGVGHLSNTPRQVLLFDALGYERPVFAHVPQVLGPDRQKLSKRHGAKAISDYHREGYPPDALVNYLSLLSWSSPTGEEVLERDRLVEEISLERIGVADAVFDPVKLDHIAAKHIERMPLDALVAAVEPFVDASRIAIPRAHLAEIVAAVRTHLSAFSGIVPLLEPFVPERAASHAADWAATPHDEAARTVLREVKAALGALAAWEPEAIDGAVRAAGKAAGAKGRGLFEPLRGALTGADHGPPLVAVISVLGRDTVLAALAIAVGESAPS